MPREVQCLISDRERSRRRRGSRRLQLVASVRDALYRIGQRRGGIAPQADYLEKRAIARALTRNEVEAPEAGAIEQTAFVIDDDRAPGLLNVQRASVVRAGMALLVVVPAASTDRAGGGVVTEQSESQGTQILHKRSP